MDIKQYKEVILKFYVDEDFEIGNCSECPLSSLGDDDDFYCPMFTEPKDCLLEQGADQS